MAAKRSRGETDRNRLEQRVTRRRRFLVNDGPFASFLAEVDHITHDERVKVLANIFGRMTPVEFEPKQLEDLPEKGRRPAA